MDTILSRLNPDEELLAQLGQLSPAELRVLDAVEIDQITDLGMTVFQRLFELEQTRRAVLASVPRTIAKAKAAYVAAGGDVADLDAVGTEPPTVPPTEETPDGPPAPPDPAPPDPVPAEPDSGVQPPAPDGEGPVPEPDGEVPGEPSTGDGESELPEGAEPPDPGGDEVEPPATDPVLPAPPAPPEPAPPEPGGEDEPAP